MKLITRIPASLYRGGTSKGPLILAHELPRDRRTLDAVLLAVELGESLESTLQQVDLSGARALLRREHRRSADLAIVAQRPMHRWKGDLGPWDLVPGEQPDLLAFRPGLVRVGQQGGLQPSAGLLLTAAENEVLPEPDPVRVPRERLRRDNRVRSNPCTLAASKWYHC